MAIEFRCTQCNKLLRTGDDTAGKQAKCPECGAILPVPTPGAGSRDASGEDGSPFASGEAPTLGPGDAENPYQAPYQYGSAPQQAYGQPVEFIAGRVAGPAIALIVTGALGIALHAFNLLGGLWQVGVGMRGIPPNLLPFVMPVGIVVAQNVLGLILAMVVILGAVKMKSLENYTFAMTASIIAMIPCIGPCCLLGIPFGIWALVVLSDMQVKTAFRS